MKCIHHNDDDGLCSAAIVRFYLKDKPEEPSDFIMYKHGQELNLPEKLNKDEIWYIVDLAMDDEIYTTIIKLLAADCKVVHIDHHKSGIEYYENLSDEAKDAIKDVVKFYETSVSGSMLTFLYAQMNEDMRKDPMNLTDVELKPNHSKYAIFDTSTEGKPPIVGDIPIVIRYVDDWDMQSNLLPDTTAFHHGFADEADKSPCADVWMHLFTQERFTIGPMVQKGNIFSSIYEKLNKNGIEHGFETTLCGHKCFATNTTAGDVKMFNSIRENYDVCCKFSYDGSIQKWTYFLVSGNGSVDVSEIAKKFGGGGHAMAAGCQTDYIIFDNTTSSTYIDHI